MIKNTDFSLDDQRKAFNKLIYEKKSKFNMIIHQEEIIFNFNDVTNCMYCNSLIKQKFTCLLQLNNFFGRFCNKICRDIYVNMHENLFSLSHYCKNIKLYPISLFSNSNELIEFFKTIDYDLILKATFKNNILEFVLPTQSKCIELKVKEYSNKISSENKCLYCYKECEIKKYIKTINNTFLGPFCSKMCKYSFSHYLYGSLRSILYYSLYIPVLFMTDNLELIKNKTKSYKYIFRGLDSVYFNEHKMIINLVIFST